MRYALHDQDENLLRHQWFEEPPPDPIGKGWYWLEAPEPPAEPVVPASITNFQARAVLLLEGHLPAVEAYIETLENPLAKAAWEYAGSVERGSALVEAVRLELGLSESEMDGLFTAAAAISV